MLEVLDRPFLGSLQVAERIARRAEEQVPAYRDFLRAHGFAGGGFSSRPIMDKKIYISPNSLSRLLGGDVYENFTVFSSGGTSGRPTLWPQLREASHHGVLHLKAVLERSFRIHEKRTVAVLASPLGVWVGSGHLMWTLKALALEAPYPFLAVTPGMRLSDIPPMLSELEGSAEQIVVFCCPSAVGHLKLLAERAGIALPWSRMRYLVYGEPMPEALRIRLQEEAGAGRTEDFAYSVYGAADSGTLGMESRASVAARRLLHEDDTIRRELGLPAPVPHLFHLAASDLYIEAHEGDLLVTRWQGVPVVRYNLRDRGRLLDWAALREALIRLGARRPDLADLVEVLRASPPSLPGVIAFEGRSDHCVFLSGSNIEERVLDEIVRDPALGAVLTGVYRARGVFDGVHQRLELTLETRDAGPPPPATMERVYTAIIDGLRRLVPLFAEEWQDFYHHWEDDPDRRILKLVTVPWPALSGEDRVKQTGMGTG